MMINKTQHILNYYLLPAGVFLFLNGLFLSTNGNEFKTIFYTFVLFPVTISLIVNRKELLSCIRRSSTLILIIVFLTYTSFTVLWSDSDRTFLHYLKRELYIFALIIGFSIIQSTSPPRLTQILCLSVISASTFAGYFLLTESSLLTGHSTRVSGPGALYNPLLASHVFGFFWAINIAALLEINWNGWHKKTMAIATCIPLTVFILMTQSRTPLLAITIMLIAYIFIHKNRKAITLTLIMFSAIALILYVHPESISNRGFSFRPYIWQYTIDLIAHSPFFGIGIDNSLSIPHPTNSSAAHWADPHNIHLSVLLYTGITGLLFWIAIYWGIYKFSLLEANTPLSRTFFFVVVYGAASALTEGSAFFSRPKEQWFIIWIPIALTIALQISETSKKSPEETKTFI